MVSMALLDATMPNITDLDFEAKGFGLWFSWKGKSDGMLDQLMGEYGGVLVAEAENQSAWFFFSSSDACLALARLRSWARFNQMNILGQLFAVKLIVGKKSEKRIICGEAILSQKIEGVERSQIWIHPSASGALENVLGLSLLSSPPVKGMSADGWKLLDVDTRLPYQPNIGWYAVLLPMGKASDKRFQKVWREFFSQIEDLLQRKKHRYNTRDSFLMFPLEGIKQLKSWCLDYLHLIDGLQKTKADEYWPCVMAIVDRKGLSFNNELPEKIGLDWQQLTPDFPHMSKENALKLGSDFSFHEDRFMPAKNSSEDWCSVSLNDERGLADANLLPNLVPEAAMGFNDHCFYCGQRSHKPADCPSRLISQRDADLWKKISLMDLNSLQKASRKIDSKLAEPDNEGLIAFMSDSAQESVILKASFDIGWAAQLRSVSFFWRVRDKDLSHDPGGSSKGPRSPAWAMLDDFSKNNAENTEKELAVIATQVLRDFRIHSLRGFAAMERGNWKVAIKFWQEAEALSTSPATASWHSFLQGRAYECINDLDAAINLFTQVARACPSWDFVAYRLAVCEVKRGFSSEALSTINTLILRDGNFFNKILLDPELERGHIQIFSFLMDIWRKTESTAKDEEIKLKALNRELFDWFDQPDHPFAQKSSEKINSLLQMGRIKNFVALQSVATGRFKLERGLQEYLSNDGARLKKTFQDYGHRLQEIRDEAAWFPFPRILAEFNKVFNKSVAEANWVLKTNMGKPESFKKAHRMTELIQEQVEYLERRMRTLCMIRDATLFILSMVETFFWIEIIGTILIFIILPLILIYGENIGLGWTAGLITKHRFDVQKILFILLSILAVGIASLRTVLRFDKIRTKVLEKAQKGPSKRQIKRAKKLQEKAVKAQGKVAKEKANVKKTEKK